MDAWKEFDHNPISHSAAHHLVAIADLLAEYGYARVSDVARLLEITRGSVSVTLKGLKQRGLVTEDDRRFLGLSERGMFVARSVRARKRLLKKLFVTVLDIDEAQADVDTCKIEHLVSVDSAEHAARFLRFALSDAPVARAFRAAFADYDEPCGGDPSRCPCCEDICLASRLEQPPATHAREGEGA